MPRVGFEPTIPAFERAKTVHTLDGAATVITFYLTDSNECFQPCLSEDGNKSIFQNAAFFRIPGEVQKLSNPGKYTPFRLVGGVECNWVHSARRPLIGLL
jgi:hypothetical protein